MAGTTIMEVLMAKEWRFVRAQKYMSDQFVPLAVKITIGYLLALFALTKLMKNRQPMKLDWLLTVWNAAFAVFSFVNFFKLLPDFVLAVSNLGVVGSYCYNSNYYDDPTSGYWGWLFTVSKVLELGDSFFLVLRKRPLIFLHWYHHAYTFLYAQIVYAHQQAFPRWAVIINLAVHAVMYSYFCLRSLKVKTPAWVAQSITTIQLVQFVIVCIINFHLTYMKLTDPQNDCVCNLKVLSIGTAMYISYLALFGHFFYKAYIVREKLGSGKVEKKA